MDNFKNIITFILGVNRNFKEVLASTGDNFNIEELQAGDIILRKMLGTSLKMLYHAGLYCGQNDVIQFTFVLNPAPSGSSFASASASSQTVMPGQNGLVDKISVKKFISNKKFYVYRLITGIPKDLPDRISTAMDDSQDYHFLKNNCLHFALRLLGCPAGEMPESQSQDTDEEMEPAEAVPLKNKQ